MSTHNIPAPIISWLHEDRANWDSKEMWFDSISSCGFPDDFLAICEVCEFDDYGPELLQYIAQMK